MGDDGLLDILEALVGLVGRLMLAKWPHVHRPPQLVSRTHRGIVFALGSGSVLGLEPLVQPQGF